MSSDALQWRIEDAQNSVFQWMAEYVEYDLTTGSEALAEFSLDWADAWYNWYQDDV